MNRSTLLAVLLLACTQAGASDAPFRTDASGTAALPDIGSGISRGDGEKALATLTEQSLSAGEYGWRSTLLDRTSSRLESLLDRYGKARIDTSLGDDGRLASAGADLLLPIDESGPRSRFTQLGVHSDHERTVTNLGVVQREQHGDWLLGYSAFVDQGGDATRLGIGNSISSDFVSLAVNAYVPVGQDDADRSERAAPGFDLDARAYLPGYPQLGGSLKFERYRGDAITMAGNDDARDNPSAVTASLHYTPVPLFSVGASYRRDDDDERDWQVQATLSYRFGVPLARQLRNDAPANSLTRRRDDFVDRNGVIAWQGRSEAEPAFSASLSGDTATSVNLSVQSQYPVVALSWLGDAAPLVVPGGPSPLLGRSGTLSARIRLALPADGRSYTLAARIVDSNGNAAVTPVARVQAPAQPPMQNGADGPV
ncbi:inverse autotransporter beta domain-containing protein [Jeongeupia sp. USM3]|uniref:inverse autotransporter beta domain-containing protein n=1 Tax=Jeongeupia sp. USM3 TaxID=1906741 RepID=UPI00089DD6A4|nr:inverse autotransporter beta domain-containing protein [Jeongeupia sp. USM3]AOY01721.1 hypothetical protein BJP62_15380 [Jeongeupia sp. USM3]